ncbi:MAG: 3-dehydroquinate synthase, partial [Pseudomonadota bacterium]
MMEVVHVDLPGRAYDIVIGPGVLEQAGARIAALGGRKHVCILTDANVAALHLSRLQDALAQAGLTSSALA